MRRDIIMLKKDFVVQEEKNVFTTPFFRNGKLPDNYEMFSGEIKVPVIDPTSPVKKYTTMPYDSMTAYQKALPGQGFAIVEFERINPADQSTTLVIGLMPAFNKGDGKEGHREHLRKLGIPFVESSEPRGKNTGIIHVRTCEMFGFPLKSPDFYLPSDRAKTGGGIIKGEEILFKSQSQNALSILWDEEFLLAHALMFYNADGTEEEFWIRRLQPEAIAKPSLLALQSEIKKSYQELQKNSNFDQKVLDNGEWLSQELNIFQGSDYEYSNNKYLAEWKTFNREYKNLLLRDTFMKAIEYKDPVSFTERISFRKTIYYTTRIFELNKTKQLNINFDECFIKAVTNGLTRVVKEFFDYKVMNDVSKINEALFIAVKSPNSDIVQLLLDNGGDKNLKNKSEESLLFLALSHGRFKTAELLLKAGATMEYNSAPLLIWAIQNRNHNAVALLLENKANPDALDFFDDPALLIAAKMGDQNLVKRLLYSNADPRKIENDELNSIQDPSIKLLLENKILALTKASEPSRTSVASNSIFKTTEEGSSSFETKNNLTGTNTFKNK